MKYSIITLILTILFLSSVSFADCSLNLSLNKTTYVPGDELIATAFTSLPGTIVFTLIDPLNQNKGTTAVTTTANNASIIFILKEAWAKGNWTIQAVLVTSSPSCEDTKTFYADTYTVPMDIDISADYTLDNVTKCYNKTINGEMHIVCLNGKIPAGFSMDLGNINLPAYNFTESIMVGTEKYIRESEYNSLLKNCSRMPHTIQGLEGNNAILTRTNEKLTENLTACYQERDQCMDGIIENELQRKDYMIEQQKLNISMMEEDNSGFHYIEALLGATAGTIIATVIISILLYFGLLYKKKENLDN